MSIKVYRSSQKLLSILRGFTEIQSVDDPRYVTAQQLSGNRHGLDVIIHGAYLVGGVQTVFLGSNIRVVLATAHGAALGDILRFDNGVEMGVLSIPDANTLIMPGELTFDPTGHTFSVFRHVTPLYNPDGSLNTVSTLPAGSATSANQVLEIAQLTAINANTAILSNDVKDKTIYSYAVPVTSGAYVQIIASTVAAARKVTIFESGGFALFLAIGAAASEVNKILVPPGGFNGEIEVVIPAGSRLSIKVAEAGQTASAGMFLINLLG